MRMQEIRNDGAANQPHGLSPDKLLFLGGLLGLMPSFRGGSGQPLAEAAQALQPAAPDFAADAEFVERELFVAEGPASSI